MSQRSLSLKNQRHHQAGYVPYMDPELPGAFFGTRWGRACRHGDVDFHQIENKQSLSGGPGVQRAAILGVSKTGLRWPGSSIRKVTSDVPIEAPVAERRTKTDWLIARFDGKKELSR